MRKTLFTTFIILCLSASGFAGNAKTVALKGKVTDKHGDPVIGAKVVIDNSESAVYTDFDGYFIFPKVPKTNHTLKISMVSFEEKESIVDLQNLTSSQTLSISLKSK